MKLRLVSPGKVREPWLQAGLAEWCKRLGRYCTVQMTIVPDIPDNRPPARILAEEADQILKHIRPQDYVVALDLQGDQPDSVALSGLLVQWLELGGGEVVFVIGGSNGLDQRVLSRAQYRLGLSRLTLTHQMTRLFLLEQCYRAFRIYHGEPYHK